MIGRELFPSNPDELKIIDNVKSLFNNSELCAKMSVFELEGELKDKFNAKIHEKIPLSCRITEKCKRTCEKNPPSYIEIFNLIQKIGNKQIMVYGGSVRDFIRTSDIITLNDIDINYSTDYFDIMNYLKSITHNDRNSCFKYYSDENKRYILFGDKYQDESGKYLEGFQIIPRTFDENSYLESRGNSLGIVVDVGDYDVNHFYLFDFFGGLGISDALNNVFCAPFVDSELTETNLHAWITQYKKSDVLWRVFKFALRGYRIEPATMITIFKYWWENTSNRELVEWNKIWDSLPIERANDIFILIKMQLDKYQDTEGIPTYEEFKKHIMDLGFIIELENGEIKGNITSNQQLNRIKKQKVFDDTVNKTQSEFILRTFFKSSKFKKSHKKMKNKIISKRKTKILEKIKSEKTMRKKTKISNKTFRQNKTI